MGSSDSLLRRKSVRLQSATGLIAQLTQGAAGVGIVLVVRAHTGSLPLAGAVVGALSIAAGVSRPVQGRLIDRRGSAGVMVVCGVLHPAALIGIAGLSSAGASGSVLIVLGAVAGLSLPPVSTSMRVIWGAIAAADRTAAYSLVYLVQELSILAGPLLLAALTAVASSSVALVAVAALAGAGTLAFAASVGRERDRVVARAALQTTKTRAGAVLRPAGIRAALALGLLVGAVIGALEVAVPVLTTAHGSPAAAGLLIAALSLGGIAGAVVYGKARWRADPAVRLLLLLAVMTLWLILLVPGRQPGARGSPVGARGRAGQSIVRDPVAAGRPARTGRLGGRGVRLAVDGDRRRHRRRERDRSGARPPP